MPSSDSNVVVQMKKYYRMQFKLVELVAKFTENLAKFSFVGGFNKIFFLSLSIAFTIHFNHFTAYRP